MLNAGPCVMKALLSLKEVISLPQGEEAIVAECALRRSDEQA